MNYDPTGVRLTRSSTLLVPVTQADYEWGIPRAEEIGVLNNSIRDGKGTLAGMIGEGCTLKSVPDTISCNTFQHDIMWKGKRIEVKTKDRTVSCGHDYEASVAAYNTRQETDYYLFTSLVRDKMTGIYTVCYIMGYIEKEAYYEQARFLREGDWDYRNNYTVQADCYNLEYSKLKKFDFLEDLYG